MRALWAAVAALFLFAGPAAAETAVLRGLDKVTGHARDFTAPVGRAVRFGTLEIIARSCSKRPAEETPEVTIYVQVFDHPPGRTKGEQTPRTEVFAGWLFASSPGISALEHPVYDVWAIDCRA
ncbi:MAG: DUF2155 domain-containing protein [Hyphomonadaceae bacterium]|nr:DUF2155 domain-containing protein [Hyphomonadaceae bacterium]